MVKEPGPERVGWTERIGYAVGDLGFCLFWNTFSIFLPYFYTDVFGISAAAAGTMLLVTRYWDSAVDPLMGIIADRTKSRFGKFRPWLLWMSVPFAISGVLTFTTPDLPPSAKLIYAYVTVTLLMLLYTATNVPYAALLGVITQSGEERTRLSSYRFIGAFAGNFIVQGTLLYLVGALGGGNRRLGYPLAIGVYGLVAVCLFLFTFRSTKERVVSVQKTESRVREDLWDLLHNRPWLILAAVNVIFQIWVGVRLASTMYYFRYVVNDEGLATSWMMAGTAFSLLGVLTATRVMRWFGGKKPAYIWLSLANAFCCGVLFFAGPADYWLIFGSHLAGSFVAAPLNALIWAMFADAADYGEWKFGRRSTGLVFSAGSFAQKAGAIGGGTIALWLLAYYGFQANMVQAPTTLFGIKMLISLLPAAASALTALVALFYTLNETALKRIGSDLQKRRRAAADAVTAN